MKILNNTDTDISGATLILGFFDGVHFGHKTVIESAVKFGENNNSKTILLTFPKSPAEYFGKKANYIYEREYNYEILSETGINYLIETDFSNLVYLSAEEYLKKIIDLYSPLAIFTGYNHTFGSKKQGNPEYLEKMQKMYDYKYFCIQPILKNNTIVSSTTIKELLTNGNINSANVLLDRNFSIESKVIKGNQIGRTMGFPTANMEYPKDIIKLPHGVYKVEALRKPAVLNWGIKPTLGGNKEIMELHIPNYNGNLYEKSIRIYFIEKIRDEKKFNNLEELRLQIKKDIEECLK